MANAPVHLHPAGMHRTALGGQVHSGFARLSLPVAAHGASEALPSAPAFPGQRAAGGTGLSSGQWQGGRGLESGRPGVRSLLRCLLVV